MAKLKNCQIEKWIFLKLKVIDFDEIELRIT
jgi:hypothetical protein